MKIHTYDRLNPEGILNQISKNLHQKAIEKGFWDEKKEIGTLLMLIVSEAAEVIEADRKGKYAQLQDPQFIIDGRTIQDDLEIYKKENNIGDYIITFEKYVKDTFEDEFADIFIRLMDLIGFYKIDIEKHIELKMFYNQTRKYKHGKKY